MQKQQGAALIIVLVLLSVSLVIGMSGMSAALVDERLASNYRASVLAQMAAETGGSKRVKLIRAEEEEFNAEAYLDTCSELSDNYGSDSFKDSFEFREVSFNKGDSFLVGYYYRGCKFEDEDSGLRDADLIIGQVRSQPGGEIDDFIGIHVMAVVDRGVGPGLSINNSPSVSSPLVCLRSSGEGCGWQDNNVQNYFDGRPHSVPSDFGCNGNSCRTSPEGEDGAPISYDADSRGNGQHILNL